MKGLQLPLGVQLTQGTSFDTFFAGPNREAVDALHRGDSPAPMLLYGASGSGKSHLLQAFIREHAAGGTGAYLPLRDFAAEGPESAEGLSEFDVVCLDDLDAVLDSTPWMLSILRLLDTLRSRGARCAVSASAPPDRLQVGLPDLATRLRAATVYGLKPLGDDDRYALLRERAAERGLQLTDDAGRLLLSRLPRDTGSLLGALDRLDRDLLSAQRRLSASFVAQWLRTSQGTSRE